MLKDLLRRELLAGPCVIPFSGGRDSSMLLAVACDVAREAGLDQPTALTLVYPGHSEADETTWQRQVLAHLRGRGLQPAWSQVRVDEEADVVGPLVAPLLHERRHVLWPPNVGATLIVARESHGATVLSGENGG